MLLILNHIFEFVSRYVRITNSLFIVALIFVNRVPAQCLAGALSNAPDDTTKVTAIYNSIFSEGLLDDSLETKCRVKEIIRLSTQLKFLKGEFMALFVKARLANHNNFQETALRLFNRAAEISEKINYGEGAMKTYYRMALIYRRLADYPNYDHYLHLLLQKASELKNMTYMSYAYEGYGNLYRYLGDYPQSIENYHKAIEISEELGNYEDVSIALNNMSLVYEYQGKITEELKVQLRNYNVLKKINKKNELLLCLSNLSWTYAELGMNKESDECLQKVTDIIKQVDIKSLDSYNLSAVYRQFAHNYLRHNDYNKAIEYYNKELKLNEENKYKKGVCDANGNLGSAFEKMGNLIHARLYRLKQLNIASETGYLDGQLDAFKALSYINKQLGNDNKAYDYLWQYIEIRDSVMNEINIKHLAETETRMKVKEQQQQIKFLSKDQKLKKLELEQKTVISSALLVVVFLILIIMSGLFWAYFQKKKVNEKLSAMVDFRTAALTKKNKDLRDFIYRSSHDLRSPIVTIKGLIQIIKNSKDKELIADCLSKANDVVEGQDKMLLGLLRVSGLIENKLVSETVNMQSLFDEVLCDIKQQGDDECVNIIGTIESGLEFQTDKMLLKSVIENLISNGIKFNRPQLGSRFVKLEAMKENKGILIKVSDNGIGISEEWKEKIFDLFTRASGKEGLGLGLYIVRNTVEKLGGTINVESELRKGTVFGIWLPNVYSN